MPIVLKWPVHQSEAYVIIVYYVRAYIFIKMLSLCAFGTVIALFICEGECVMKLMLDVGCCGVGGAQNMKHWGCELKIND